MREVRKRSAVVVADAGGAPGGTSPYDHVKFEAILKGELATGIAAHNLGGPEVKLGVDYLRRVARRLGAPFVSANLRDRRGELIAQPYRIVEAADRRVAIIGVLSPRYATAEVQVGEPREAVLSVLSTTAEQSDWTVVLAYLPEEELNKLAEELPEVDVVVGGPTGQAISPTRVGPAVLASATNKGKFLVELQAPAGDQQTAWRGRVIELTSQFDDDAAQRKNLDVYLNELARRDFTAAETHFAARAPATFPKDYRVAGTRSCLPCHREDCRHWRESRHAHAWQTLVEGNSHVDSYCQQCHTTSYGLPGGFQSARRSTERVDVGCESCHGPSQAHVLDPELRTPFAAGDQCERCHDRENSPQFEYAAFWQQIVHGTSAGVNSDAARQTDTEDKP